MQLAAMPISLRLPRFRQPRAAAPAPAAVAHPRSLLTLEQTATDRRAVTPFIKTYAYSGDFINEEHAGFTTCATRYGMIDIGIEGWLLPADALKLYELAYFAEGDVLELGTYRGLSAAVIRRAIVASGRPRKLLSIDLDPGSTRAGQAACSGQPGAGNVHFFNTSADEALTTFARAGRRFGLCFIDHSHTEADVASACALLAGVLRPGAFCLFHDYNDPRNADAGNQDYGVYQAVGRALLQPPFAAWGVYGCCGLFRYEP
jgi:SAM-dependent methyltransferase